MLCPKCHKDNIAVIDSRDTDDESIRRRRQCVKCRYRFTTYERIEPIKFMVTKKDGSSEPYDRNKVIRGISLATEKRGISPRTIERLVDSIEQQLIQAGEGTITSRNIGDLVIKHLKKLDEVSYIRFASVYKVFRTPKAFANELKKLNKK
ncbi:MAG TPA: transcriptional regulator NrdR [bacterium]|nr:transcriptional regulator NrdR [bacterium]HOR57078.1 transcriptional regulator NrdR [bacterium]HPL55965.1 transcriptional regulator NrdR [bacterium]